MSFNVGGSSGSGSTTTQIPEWLQQDWEGFRQKAQDTANNPNNFKAYTGELTPNAAPETTTGQDLAKQVAGGLEQYSAQNPSFNNLGYAGLQQALNTETNMAQGVPGAQGAASTSHAWTNLQTPTIGATPDAHAYGATASDIDRGDIRNVQACQGGGSELNRYLNPWTDDVVNKSLNDIDLTRQRGVNQNSSDATMGGGEGGWGGARAGVSDSLTNEAALRQAAQTSAQLRGQGFDTATGLQQSDLARALQASQANAGTDLSVANANAGLDTDVSKYNAGSRTQNSQFNATDALQRALQQAQLGEQTGLANQSWFNQNANNNATRQQDMTLANMGSYNSELDRMLSASGLLNQTAPTQLNSLMLPSQIYEQVGQQRQQQGQAVDTANYNEWLRQQQFPQQQLNDYGLPFGMYPTTGSGSSSTTHSSGKNAGVGVGG